MVGIASEKEREEESEGLPFKRVKQGRYTRPIGRGSRVVFVSKGMLRWPLRAFSRRFNTGQRVGTFFCEIGETCFKLLPDS